MQELEHHSFKKMYYVFAFSVLLLVATMLGYFLVYSAIPNKAKMRDESLLPTATPTPLFDESKETEEVLDQEIVEVENGVNSSDFSSLENEDLSGLE